MAEIRELPNGFQVVEGEKVIGTAVKVAENCYDWHSALAKPPFHQGSKATDVEVLAHLGYKVKGGKNVKGSPTT